MTASSTWIDNSLSRLERLEAERNQRAEALQAVEQRCQHLLDAHQELLNRLESLRREGRSVQAAMGETDQARNQLHSSIRALDGQINDLCRVLEAVADDEELPTPSQTPQPLGGLRVPPGAIQQPMLASARESLEILELDLYDEIQPRSGLRWLAAIALLLTTAGAGGGYWAHTQGTLPSTAEAQVAADRLLERTGLASALGWKFAPESEPEPTPVAGSVMPLVTEPEPAPPKPLPAEPSAEAAEAAVAGLAETESAQEDGETKSAQEDGEDPAAAFNTQEDLEPEDAVQEAAKQAAKSRRSKRNRRRRRRSRARAKVERTSSVAVTPPKQQKDSIRIKDTKDPLAGLK